MTMIIDIRLPVIGLHNCLLDEYDNVSSSATRHNRSP